MQDTAGWEDDPGVCFLFIDTQILDEAFVEDLNSLLNNGMVQGLFAPDEMLNIMENLREPARKASIGPCGGSAPCGSVVILGTWSANPGHLTGDRILPSSVATVALHDVFTQDSTFRHTCR